MCTHLRLHAPCFLFPGLVVLTILALAAAADTACAQAAAAKGAAPTSSSGASGFSIETEMLTYRALESNGEAIACDVAGYLYNTKADFRSLPTGAICNVAGSTGASTLGVVVMPFDRSLFADFQLWRSDMQAMAEFEQRGAAACEVKTPPPAETTPPPPAGTEAPRGRGLTAPTTPAPAGSALSSVLSSLTPSGAAIGAASGVLGLFSSSSDSSPVGGTIEDQAFMDNVSRELRAVNVNVLMPSVYAPFTLTSVDPAHSPFLVAFDKLLHTRDCMVAAKTYADDLKVIDAFIDAIHGTTTPAKSAAPASATGSGGGSGSGSGSGAGGAATPAAQPAAPSPAHLQAILSADGLAQRLGADPATGMIPATSPQHLLLVKALESGGSVIKSTNIFGSRTKFSGGSVGTYALFGLNGDLECSGNVYDYAGYVPAKNFQGKLRAYVPDPSRQVIFQRGACKVH